MRGGGGAASGCLGVVCRGAWDSAGRTKAGLRVDGWTCGRACGVVRGEEPLGLVAVEKNLEDR